MTLTRTGYYTIVMAWLAPIVLFDVIANTILTGRDSEYFYYKTMADGILMAYALWQMFGRAATVSAKTAAVRTADVNDSVIGLDKLGSWEWISCLILVVYALINWYSLKEINTHSTGIVSTATLVWSMVSIVVAGLSAIQFYQVKSGAIGKLTHQLVA